MTISQTIKNLRKKELNLSQEAFAERLGVNAKTIGFWESGKNEPNKSNLLSICNEFDLPKTYFDNVRNVILEADDCITIEQIHINPSCGTGTIVLAEADVTPIKIGREIIKNLWNSKPEDLKIFKASGDSMQETIIDNDLLLIDTSKIDFHNGGIFLLTINNDWYIKRLRMRLTGELDIISDNIKYPIETLQPDTTKDIKVIGRVIKNLSRGL